MHLKITTTENMLAYEGGYSKDFSSNWAGGEKSDWNSTSYGD